MISPENASFLLFLAGLGLEPARIRTLGIIAAILDDDLEFFLGNSTTADSSNGKYTVSPSFIKDEAGDSSADKKEFSVKTTEPKLLIGKPTSTFRGGPTAPMPSNRFVVNTPEGWKPRKLTTKKKIFRFF